MWLPRLAATAVGVVVAATVPGLFARRFGGITGDVLGATVLLTEAFLLVIGAMAGGPL
jgi:cobalamin synthase